MSTPTLLKPTNDTKPGKPKELLKDIFLRNQVKRDLLHKSTIRIHDADPLTGKNIKD